MLALCLMFSETHYAQNCADILGLHVPIAIAIPQLLSIIANINLHSNMHHEIITSPKDYIATLDL